MLHVVTALWDANLHSQPFSRDYDESWVEKLYRGFARNLSDPFRFVVFTDRLRTFAHPEIAQEGMMSVEPDYGSFTEPYRLGEPMILCGLDTIVTGNCDRLARATLDLEGPVIALPRDPYARERACNGVALAPGGRADIYERWHGENDMEWARLQPHVFIDDLFPGEVVSYKGEVKKRGLGDARIVYFHGWEKPPEARRDVTGLWIKDHWV